MIVGKNSVVELAKNAALQSKIEDAREKITVEVVNSVDKTGEISVDQLKENLESNLDIDTSGMGDNLPTGTFYLDDMNFYVDEEGNVIYGENEPTYNPEEQYVPQTDGSWNEEKGVNSPELFEGMTAVYWDSEGVEHELTEDSTEKEWEQWYDYNGNGDGENKWANAVTKDENGNITGYWVWIPRFAYKIESGLFTSTAGTISIKFLQGTSDLDEEGNIIGRTYSYSGEAMTDYVVHPAFRD